MIVQADLKEAAEAIDADAFGWRFAPGLGFTSALILMLRGGHPIAQAPLHPSDHEHVRKYGRAVALFGAGLAPLRATLQLPDNFNDFAKDIAMVERCPQAKQVVQYADQFGRCHIEFIAADGSVIGRATMACDDYARFIGDGCDVLAVAKEGGLATLPHAGVA